MKNVLKCNCVMWVSRAATSIWHCATRHSLTGAGRCWLCGGTGMCHQDKLWGPWARLFVRELPRTKAHWEFLSSKSQSGSGGDGPVLSSLYLNARGEGKCHRRHGRSWGLEGQPLQGQRCVLVSSPNTYRFTWIPQCAFPFSPLTHIAS